MGAPPLQLRYLQAVAWRCPFCAFCDSRVCAQAAETTHSDNTRIRRRAPCSAPRIFWRRMARRAPVKTERRLPVCMMLADRRVARTGRRSRPLSSYARPLLCLIAALLHDPASASAVPPSTSGARRGRPRIAVVGSGGGDVGVAAQRPWGVPAKVWTAALASAVHGKGWSKLVPTAAAFADPSTEATARERVRRLLLSVRGGSEGLKSEKWNREKAAAGEAARARREARGGVGEVRRACAYASCTIICVSSCTPLS